MPLSVQTDDELREFVRQELRRSDEATLIRQLQGLGRFVPLAFAANWTDYATSVPDLSQSLCGSYVNAQGEVVVQGLARRVGAVFGFPTTIGTLPVEHRPATNHVFTCWSTDTSPTNSIWAVLVQTSGAIIAFSCVGSASGAAGTYVYLDGIRFRRST